MRAGLGVHKMTFRIDSTNFLVAMGLGVVPVAHSLCMGWYGWLEGYELSTNGGYYAASEQPTADFGVAARYGTGDEVTVRLDLDANTVTFIKNGVDVGSPQDVPNEPYYFMFDSATDSDVVTIVEK